MAVSVLKLGLATVVGIGALAAGAGGDRPATLYGRAGVADQAALMTFSRLGAPGNKAGTGDPPSKAGHDAASHQRGGRARLAGGIAGGPAPSASFAALGDNNTVTPPSPSGAVGPAHLLVATNSQVRVQDRAGAAASTVGLDAFWAGTQATGCFSPRVAYDPYGQRWIMAAAAFRGSSSSALLVGVSLTGDPTGDWKLYRLDVDASDTFWAGDVALGFGQRAIAVSVNLYRLHTNAYHRARLYAFDKADATV